MKKLRWGIVSTGRIAEQFTADMQFVDNGEVIGVAARDIANAEKFALKHNIEKAYGNYQALFDDSEIDIIYIGTPHTSHFDNAKSAMLSGKHVLCEKPLTVGAEQTQYLINLAKKQNVFLMEAMWTYFLPAIRQAKRWVDEGKIGKIKHVKADFGYPMAFDPKSRVYNTELAGGCLMDMGIYPLAIAAFFINKDITNLHVNSHLAPNGVDDDVNILAEFGDVKATLGTSFQCKLPNWAYVIGDKGYIAIKDFWRASSCSYYVLDNEVETFSDNRRSQGLNFEAISVGENILSGEIESDVMTHERSLWLQNQMEKIKTFF